MPKKPNNKPQREMTRRQITHWQRESRIQRFTLIGGIIIIIAVLALIGTGVYLNKFRPYQATVIKVDNTSYNMDYYIDLLAYIGKINGNPQYIQYFSDAAVNIIEQDYFYVREAAKQYNITVSDDEVKAEIKTEGAPDNQAVRDGIRSRLLTNKFKDYFDKDPTNGVPASADGKTVQAMFLESQSQVNDVKSRMQNGEKFSDIAAQLSLESTSKNKNGDFGWVPPGVLPSILSNTGNKTLEDKVFSKDTPANNLTQVEDSALTKNVGYWLIEVSDAPVATPTPTPTSTGTPAPQAHVLAMVLSSEQQAAEIKARLQAGGPGNDFASLAKQYSSYADAATNGGDLGSISKGAMPAAVDKVIFPQDASQALPKNTVSGPIQDTTQTTSGGIWLLQASETQNKAIEGANRTTLINDKITTWQNKVWEDNKASAQNLLTSDQKDFAVKQAESRASK